MSARKLKLASCPTIAERRRLVSSIKNSIANPEEGEASNEQSENFFPELDLTSTSVNNVVEGQNGKDRSSSYVNFTANEVPEILSSAVTRSSDVDGKKSGKSLPPKEASFNRDSSKQLKETNLESAGSGKLPSFLGHASEISSVKAEEHEDSKPLPLSAANDIPKPMKETNQKGTLSNELPYFRAYTSEISSWKDDELENLKSSRLQELTSNASDPAIEDPKTPSSAGVKVMPQQLKDTDSEAVWSDKFPSFLTHTSEISSLKDEEQEDSKGSSTPEHTGEVNVAPIEDAKPPPLAGANVMNVILVATECAPWSKTGGLGDVAGTLPKALARRGHRVMVVAPLYGNYAEPQDIGVRKRYKVDGQDMEVSYFQAYIDGVDLFSLTVLSSAIERVIYMEAIGK